MVSYSGSVLVDLDDSTVGLNSGGTLQVKDGGITPTKLAVTRGYIGRERWFWGVVDVQVPPAIFSVAVNDANLTDNQIGWATTTSETDNNLDTYVEYSWSAPPGWTYPNTTAVQLNNSTTSDVIIEVKVSYRSSLAVNVSTFNLSLQVSNDGTNWTTINTQNLAGTLPTSETFINVRVKTTQTFKYLRFGATIYNPVADTPTIYLRIYEYVIIG